MKKYYYVIISSGNSKEMFDALGEVTTTKSLCYSGPSATYLLNVKKTIGRKKEKTALLHIEYETEYTYYDAFPILCERAKTKDGKDCVIDIITGKAFYINNRSSLQPIPSVSFIFSSEISSGNVVKLLNSLTSEDIARYKQAMDKLIYNVRLGYNNYVRRVKNDNDQRLRDDEYIRKFRDKHGR